MPTVGRSGPYRFFFFGNEGAEPPHVHVQRDRSLAKFWLSPVALASTQGFSVVELRRIQSIIEERCYEFEEAWNGFFST